MNVDMNRDAMENAKGIILCSLIKNLTMIMTKNKLELNQTMITSVSQHPIALN